MREFIKENKVTIVVVLATIALAAVAIFTALRLYQLRDESVSPAAPESEPGAWICSEYTFRVAQDGEVFARNASVRDEPQQSAKVLIDAVEVATLQVPALGKNTAEVSIGNVTVPGSSFVWEVIGTKDCADSGSYDPSTCTLEFTIDSETSSPSPSPSSSPSPSPSSTPSDYSCNSTCTTDAQCQTSNSDYVCSSSRCRHSSYTYTEDCQPPGNTDSPSPSPSPSDTPVTSSTPSTPTSSGAPALPDAGVGLPTIAGMGIGALLLLGAILLAI